MEPRIFCFWMGPVMDEVRLAGLRSLRETSGVHVELIIEEDFTKWMLPGFPFHAGFKFLSAVHRADYLRTYFMHHYGGGYSDIKATTGSWFESFDLLESKADIWGIGYREVGRHGVAAFGADSDQRRVQPTNPNWWKWRFLQLNFRHLLGNCAYIFKPRTTMTARWLHSIETRLDDLLPILEKNPAKYPKERAGLSYDGCISEYPVPWSYLLGDIFHPLCYKYRRSLGFTLPLPSSEQYQ